MYGALFHNFTVALIIKRAHSQTEFNKTRA